jgi:hypothetical protein
MIRIRIEVVSHDDDGLDAAGLRRSNGDLRAFDLGQLRPGRSAPMLQAGPTLELTAMAARLQSRCAAAGGSADDRE